jgi:uncharacterized membrane protein
MGCRKRNKLFLYIMQEMRVSFTRLPIDLVLCLIGCAILIVFVVFNIVYPVRLILGISFILFIPGYVLVFALFPSNRLDGGISFGERIGLSLVASVAIIPLFGLALNFSPWGISLYSILLTISFFIFCVGIFGLFRWYSTSISDRLIISFNSSFLKFENNFNKIFTIILGALILTAVLLTIYVIVVPKEGEKFTEFYILDVNGRAYQYPQNLSIEANASSVNVTAILGISNHEYKKMTYSIQVWLVNQTISYNFSERKNETVINQMWLVYEDIVILNHDPINLDPQSSQWEKNISFSLNRTGFFKLAFLLFKSPNEAPILYETSKETANQIFNTAYRELYLWITIT